MPTPMFNFRLPSDQARKLEAVAKIYGTNTSVFLREMIGAFCGGHPSGPAYFLEKLGSAMGQQRQLELFAQEQAQRAVELPKEGKRAPKERKGAKRANRAT